MKQVPITLEMIDRAKLKADEIGKLRNSIRSGNGNFIGFLGEEVVLSALPLSSSANTYDYDILFNDIKIDVKTKERTVMPRPYYECSVADFNTTQKCDYYVFVSILVKNNIPITAYILGEMKKEIFYQKATKHTKGEVDKRNNFTFRADCYNIEISKLNQWELE